MWILVVLAGVLSTGESEMFIYPTKFSTEIACQQEIPKARGEIEKHLDEVLPKGSVVALSVACMLPPTPGQDL